MIIIFGSFRIRKLLQERKLNRQISQVLKRADTKYHHGSVRKQTGRVGSRLITSYYPLAESKQDIGVIKEKINEYHGTNLQGNPIDQPDSVSDDGLL